MTDLPEPLVPAERDIAEMIGERFLEVLSNFSGDKADLQSLMAAQADAEMCVLDVTDGSEWKVKSAISKPKADETASLQVIATGPNGTKVDFLLGDRRPGRGAFWLESDA